MRVLRLNMNGLEALYKPIEKGLEKLLAFLANQFGHQDPVRIAILHNFAKRGGGALNLSFPSLKSRGNGDNAASSV